MVWKDGETISPLGLNRIEEAVASMNESYTPTVWAVGDTITAEKMNKLEQGVADMTPSGKLIITSTEEVNVASYATAQVVDADLVAGNIKKDVDILGVVGSYEGGGASDFSTASVNIVTSGATVRIPYIAESEGDLPDAMVSIGITESGNYTVPMYKGTLAGTISSFGRTVQVTGAAEWVSESETIIITGDCTITVASET